jgi:hypothetical protein
MPIIAPYGFRPSARTLSKANNELALRLKQVQVERDNYEVLLAALILDSGTSRVVTDADLEATKDVTGVVGSRVDGGILITVNQKPAVEHEIVYVEDTGV